MMSEYSRLTKSEIINFERSVNPSPPAPLPPKKNESIVRENNQIIANTECANKYLIV